MSFDDYKSDKLSAEIHKNDIELMAKAKLAREIAEKKNEKFTFFWNGPFSQWHKSNFTIDGVDFNCAEQYMMYKKALLFHDYEIAEKIMNTSDPKEQKALGKKVSNFNTDKWNGLCKGFVYDGNEAKFNQNRELLVKLIDTVNTTLVEASPYDKIWGIGLKENDPKVKSRDTWEGTNWLGEVLTRLRGDILRVMR